jgi:quinolinate synthase
VELADEVGSTEYILRRTAELPAGSTIAIGTEVHMVRRLAAEHPDKVIFTLDPLVCPCSTMFRIDQPHLAWVLDNLVQGKVVNRITVDPDTAHHARVALQRMLDIT